MKHTHFLYWNLELQPWNWPHAALYVQSGHLITSGPAGCLALFTVISTQVQYPSDEPMKAIESCFIDSAYWDCSVKDVNIWNEEDFSIIDQNGKPRWLEVNVCHYLKKSLKYTLITRLWLGKENLCGKLQIQPKLWWIDILRTRSLPIPQWISDKCLRRAYGIWRGERRDLLFPKI